MKYYIEVGTVNKAKQDIDEICRREGFTNLTRHNFGSGGLGRFMTKLASVTSILWTLKKGDTLFLQYPMKKFYYMACSLAKMKGAHVVTVIHDLGAFRRHKLTPEGENSRLSKTDFIIAHNPTMRHYLVEHGFKGGIHCLQIFDYLSPHPLPPAQSGTQATGTTTPAQWRIVYAGNLGRWRNEFLYRLEPVMKGWRLDLYGKGFDPAHGDGQHATDTALAYHGFIDSDDFIATAGGDRQAPPQFGLVWDGDSLDECTGDWGEYLRINDPHKTSFYLRAGIPVIVWRQAAMAPFIEEQRVGIAIDGISQLTAVLSHITPGDYAQMRRNALDMGRRLNDGYYIKKGLEAAEAYLSATNNTIA